MKKLTMTLGAFAFMATTATAGSLAPVVEDVVEAPVIIEETGSSAGSSGSAGNAWIPIALLVLVGAAIASSSDS